MKPRHFPVTTGFNPTIICLQCQLTINFVLVLFRLFHCLLGPSTKTARTLRAKRGKEEEEERGNVNREC